MSDNAQDWDNVPDFLDTVPPDDEYDGPSIDWNNLTPPDEPVEPNWETFGYSSFEPDREVLPLESSIDAAMDAVYASWGQIEPAPEAATPIIDAELYDARFLGKELLDEHGNIASYVVQCMEIYQDTDGNFSGRVLDVAHFTDPDEAELIYTELQTAPIPIDMVSMAGEQVAEESTFSMQWQEATPEDFEAYQYHVAIDEAAYNTPKQDIYDDALRILSQPVNPVTAETQQAIDALVKAGLNVSDKFDLERDTFLDAQTGYRVINTVFQEDIDDPAANCQAVFISLAPPTDGFEANITPFGSVGSIDDAWTNSEAVQTALYTGGPESAFDAMEQIDLAIEPQPIFVSRSLDIDL